MEIKTKWDLGQLYSSDSDPKIEEDRKKISKLTEAFVSKWKPRTDWLEDPAMLLEAIENYEAWHKECAWGGTEAYYFGLKTALDENDAELKAKNDKAEEFARKIGVDTQFFALKLAKLTPEMQSHFVYSPVLSKYKHFLEVLFAESKYILSEAEEKILTLTAAPAHGHWVRMVSGFIAKEERPVLTEEGKTENKNFSDLMILLENQNKNVRDAAGGAINEILDKHSDVAEAELNAILASKKIEDELRGLPRPDASRHLSDDVEADVVDTLVSAVSERFDVPRRYYVLRAKLMGVPKLKYHERKVPYGNVGRKFSFEEAVFMVRKVFEGLDPKFLKIFDDFLAKGQIDAFPSKGKHGGAFCAHYTTKHPTYILLNHGETLDSVQTMAHEVGHGINNELMREAQPEIYFGAPTSTAEVASTFTEDFVLDEILKTADPETRLAIMINKLNDDVSTIFRQVACYKFETELHQAFREKGYLSKKDIGDIFRKNMEAYMGEAVEQSPGSENWWIYWEHIRNFFYVYSYAMGLLIGKAMQNGVRNDPAFIEKVKLFLSAGTSESPKNIFKEMEIDITSKEFWNNGIAETEKLLLEAEALAKELGKI